MCLSTVYKNSKPDEAIMEYVSNITFDGDNVICTDLMGEKRAFKGKLTFVDLTGGVIRIDCEE